MQTKRRFNEAPARMRGKTCTRSFSAISYAGFNEAPARMRGKTGKSHRVVEFVLHASMRPPHECGGKLCNAPSPACGVDRLQ